MCLWWCVCDKWYDTFGYKNVLLLCLYFWVFAQTFACWLPHFCNDSLCVYILYVHAVTMTAPLHLHLPFNIWATVFSNNKRGKVFTFTLLEMHYDTRCVIHLLCCTVAGLHVCHQDDGRGGWRRRERAQLMACWWPDCSGPAAHWAVIATAGASGTDSSGAPIAQSWHLPLSTVYPDQPLTMPFVLTDGKTEVWNQPISSSTDLSFFLVFLGSSINHFQPHFFTLYLCLLCPALLSFPSKSLSSSHPPFCFQSAIRICLFNIPSTTLPPFALAFTFIYLDRFHLGGNNPLTGSFIRMTSSNPFVAVGWINPAHSLALTEFIMEAQIQSA